MTNSNIAALEIFQHQVMHVWSPVDGNMDLELQGTLPTLFKNDLRVTFSFKSFNQPSSA